MSGGTLLGVQSAPAAAGFDPASLSWAFWGKFDTISGSDGDPIGTLADISGNGRDATQATSSKKFTLRTAVANGLNVGESDGVDDALQTANFTFNQPAHLFAVVKLLSRPAGHKYVIDGNIADVTLYSNGGNSKYELYGGATLSGPTNDLTTFHVVSWKWNGASSSIRLDQASAITGNAGTQALGGLAIGSARGGGSAFANCQFGEILASASILSGSDETGVLDYLKAKWGTP